MDDLVTIVECPRDAWQGLPTRIPADVKAAYLNQLFAARFSHVDAVSFVSPAAVPQMADSEKVLETLEIPNGANLIGIVVNVKGAERAIHTGRVQTLGFPYSISAQFLRRNQNQTPEESIRVLRDITVMARESSLKVVAYVSMAFGNPYGEPWSVGMVAAACDLLIESGVRQISIADTVGLATPARIAETLAHLLAAHREVEIGVHLHGRPSEAEIKIRAAYDAGCRRFDAAIGGLGGCPFAQDELVGNIATETLIAELAKLGAQLPRLQPLDALIHSSAEIAQKYGGGGRP